MARRPEAQLQKAVAQYLSAALDQDRAMWRGIENQPRSAIAGANQKARGIQAGTPDILLWWRYNQGRECYRVECAGIELKSKTGRQRPDQASFEYQFLCIGGHYRIARSLEEVETALRAWGVPLRAQLRAA